MQSWSPSSWRSRPASQQPVYPDEGRLAAVMADLSALPPLVTPWEVDRLKSLLAEAAQGRAFLLQGGDCAERFSDCNSDCVTSRLKVLLQMSLVLIHGVRKPVVRVGRFAGQYAKPRSDDLETRGGVTLASYRGDLVNRPGFTEADRMPDPELLLRGYERSALTLNYIRALVKGGFADLHHPEYWDLGFASRSELADQYHEIVRSVRDSLRFMENIVGAHALEMEQVDFFASHEGLHLPYEEAQTRPVPHRDGWYNLSTHMPWLGLRTADPEGAHVEYFRGIANPIGVKIGARLSPDTVLRLLDILDPENEPGRVTLIHRYGCRAIRQHLPCVIDAVRASGRTPLWCCDPMHGNTKTTNGGLKTRDFSDILSELEQAFEIHAERGNYLGGVHFELTGEHVTECIGGARGLTESDLHDAYKTEVDPRLNAEQALEMSMLITRKLSSGSGKRD